MLPVTLIADGGATKTEWCLLSNGRKKTFLTQGIRPYFLTSQQIADLVGTELLPSLKNVIVANLFYYGTGCLDPKNAKSVKNALKALFPDANIEVGTDFLGAAKAVCGDEKGVACILGTGSNSCSYNGKKIIKNSPGIGYVLGDEGSGAYLGRKVLQYYLYETFDEELKSKFDAKYGTTSVEILENVYKKPFPNRYIASFTLFLAENRGHYMIENILEDGLNDFFFQHLTRYKEALRYPVGFVGSVAYGFKDVLTQLCQSYEFELGKILKTPMQGLVKYHSE
jgi:N-acetylglucosamine kinase-like BadF-type ATPase